MGLIVERISNFNNAEKLTQDVITLSDENKKTLGFIPRKAIQDRAKQGDIFVAVQEDTLVGYLLFRRATQENRFVINQLCIRPSERGKKISYKLIDKLKLICEAEKRRGIFIKTREDYRQASKVWSRNDFIPKGESAGRGKNGMKLTHWWWENLSIKDLFNSPTFFDDEKVPIGIDHNIIIALMKHNDDTICSIFESDWLLNEVDVCVQDESYKELLRDYDHDRRDETRRFMSNFSTRPYDMDVYQKSKKVLADNFLPSSKAQDESDINHIAYAVASRCQYFVTMDKILLEQSHNIADKLSITVCSPDQLYMYLDEDLHKERYHPVRLGGSHITVSQLSVKDAQEAVRCFFMGKRGEKKNSLEKIITNSVSHKENDNLHLVQDGDSNFLALIGSRTRNDNIREIFLLRILNGALKETLCYQIIQNHILEAEKTGCSDLLVTDQYANDYSSQLVRLGFQADGEQFRKRFIRTMLKIVEDSPIFSSGEEAGLIKDELGCWRSLIEGKYWAEVIDVEKRFWPMKFSGVSIPVYLIPIQPVWAKDLFDQKLANNYLPGLGGDPLLAFNIENAYYTATQTKMIAPARILWYVSQEPHLNPKGAIRATSYLDEVVKGNPKELFTRYKRLGVYSWQDVLDTAKGDLDQRITALRFSNTELLRKPIKHEEVLSVMRKYQIKSNNMITAKKVSERFFFHIYSTSQRGH